jgi:hypothetical protein
MKHLRNANHFQKQHPLNPAKSVQSRFPRFIQILIFTAT